MAQIHAFDSKDDAHFLEKKNGFFKGKNVKLSFIKLLFLVGEKLVSEL